jgi:CubicO group peptidase (beta-lactamase class C family)
LRPDGFEARYGFPRAAVTLGNWRKAPFSRWSFQNLRELAPTAPMNARRGSGPEAPDAAALWAEAITLDGRAAPLGAFLAETATDVLLALKDGRPRAGWLAPHALPDAPHLLFSVSKSLTALVAGALAAQDALDLDAPVRAYVPEAEGSAYGDAGLRHLLDMRASLSVDELYGDERGWGARYCRAVLWDPQGPHPAETHLSLLLAVRKGDEAHGGPFRYRSANSDMLGVVLARAGGRPFAALARELLWEPLGAAGEAYVSVDREGTAQTAGGMAATAYDLAGVGEMMRAGGAAGPRQVVPEAFVHDALASGDADAWAAGDFAALFPGARYRSKWYALPDGAFFASGIHGQWLFVDPRRAVTVVKLSAQPEAKSDAADQLSLALLRAVAQRL